MQIDSNEVKKLVGSVQGGSLAGPLVQLSRSDPLCSGFCFFVDNKKLLNLGSNVHKFLSVLRLMWISEIENFVPPQISQFGPGGARKSVGDARSTFAEGPSSTFASLFPVF